MLKTGIIQSGRCFLCNKKAYKEIKDDINIFDLPFQKISLCQDHYQVFHVGNVLGQMQLNNILLSFILNLDDEVKGEELREKLFELVPNAKHQFKRIIPENNSNLRMSPREFYDSLNQKVIGQEQAKKRISITVFEHLRNISKVKTNEKFNILLLGPSGSGKTLIVNTISEKMSVPVANGDATSYSPTGFQGSDVDSVIHELYLKSNGNLENAQNGIVFIDEIDKLASYNHSNTKSEALHSATQSSMLKLIEGKKVKIPQSITGEQGPPVLFDTDKVLFCFGGAFNGLQDIVGKKLGYTGRRVTLKNDESNDIEEQIKSFEIYNQASHEILTESLIEYGLSTEFVGRIQTIVALSPLDYDQLKECLIGIPASPLVKNTLLFAESNYKTTYTDEFIDGIISRVLKMGTGTRALNSLVKKAVSGAAFDLLGNFNTKDSEVIFDSDCIDSPEKYVLKTRTRRAKSVKEL
jgi:ATP-dependent Clp protease ATP-binding subunit ClpX